MMMMIKRKITPILIISTTLILLLLIKWWKKRDIIYPALIFGEDGEKLKIDHPAIDRENVFAFFTVLTEDSNMNSALQLVKSLQANLINKKEVGFIAVFHPNSPAFNLLKVMKFVKSYDLDKVMAEDVRWKSNVDKVIKAVPLILEHLLLGYAKAVYVDCNFVFHEKRTLPILIRLIAKSGEVIVPSTELASRTAKLNPAMTDISFPLLAYTRKAFVDKVQPMLDCQRGLSCKLEGAGKPDLQSVVRKSRLFLEKASLKRKVDLAFGPVLDEIFDRVGQPKEDRPLKIGLGLEISPHEDIPTFLDAKVRPLLRNLESQSLDQYNVIVYIMSKSNLQTTEVIINALEPLQNEMVSFRLSNDLAPIDLSNQIMATMAIKDGCKAFHGLGEPPLIPKGPWIINLINNMSPRVERMNLLTFIDGDDDIWLLKELVGSIHGVLYENRMEPPPLVLVVGSNMTRSNQAMVKLWEHVEFYSVTELLYGMPSDGVEKMEKEKMKLSLIWIFVERFGSVVWLDPSIFFTATAGLEQSRSRLITTGLLLAKNNNNDLVIEGYDKETFMKVQGRFTKCITTFECDQVLDMTRLMAKTSFLDAESAFGVKSSLPKPVDPKKRGQNYCHLGLRKEIMYLLADESSGGSWAHEDDQTSLIESKQIKVAFLIPSKNDDNATLDSVHFIEHFFKSLLRSIKVDEWEKFTYTIYLGYDQDDPVLDKKRLEFISKIDSLQSATDTKVLLKFKKLPTVKCITMLWNILFVEAVKDGNDYFYQVNDDVTIKTAGWTSAFVETLAKNDNFGVTGPNDRMWNCRLLTQSFVSRKHHEIFGWYFPIIIKDWFSDNWINSVYDGEDTVCQKGFLIENGASPTRYSICDQPKWLKAVEQGKERIIQWKKERLERMAH